VLCEVVFFVTGNVTQVYCLLLRTSRLSRGAKTIERFGLVIKCGDRVQ
jgi:hypothetical protein